MKDLLSKLSSYNLFNYLVPGVVFVALSQAFTGYSLVHDNLLIAAFLYYFIGLVISRIGSLVIEPAFKKLGFIRFADYGDFVAASRKDTKLELLSEVNNSYRTLCSMFLLLPFLKLYGRVETALPSLHDWNAVFLFAFLFALFILSYRKQTAYITKRIEANK